MQVRPYRTGTTWLTDDQLVLLDVLFNIGIPLSHLGRADFLEGWNLGYAHTLDDDALTANVCWLCDQGVLDAEAHGTSTVLWMTPAGGELWSQERCPVWERYCTEQYRYTSQGKRLMTVLAVSSEVRDHFLSLWPEYPARRRTTVITNHSLLGWRPFPQLYVGMAVYEETERLTAAEFEDWQLRYRQHWAKLERERSWWRSVPELQRFVPRPTSTTDLPSRPVL